MRTGTLLLSFVVLAVAALLLASCRVPTSPRVPTPEQPGPGTHEDDELAVFLVGAESFRVRLATPEVRSAAHEAFAGDKRLVPIGRISKGADLNSGWSWHLTDLAFAETTVEQCDGRPSDVERAGGPGFGNGWYCPWDAEFVAILPLR